MTVIDSVTAACFIDFHDVSFGVFHVGLLDQPQILAAETFLVDVDNGLARSSLVSGFPADEKKCGKHSIITKMEPDRGSPMGGQIITLTVRDKQ